MKPAVYLGNYNKKSKKQIGIKPKPSNWKNKCK
jgi:hypothetical protein